MSLASEVNALRSSAGLCFATHVAVVQVSGPGALELLQRASTQSPYQREGRVRNTLLLRDDASVLADAFIVNLGDVFLVLAEGPSEAELVQWLTTLGERTPEKPATVLGMASDTVVLGVDGPYAWEVVSGLLGPGVLGMPYLTLLAKDELFCVRAGKTGEYGYLLLVPRASAERVVARLRELGGPLDLTDVGLEALDVCGLESWHFTMRSLRDGARVQPLTPIELQLQWRVVSSRDFVGVAALRARKAEGPKARVTCFVADGPVLPGQRVRLGDRDVGEVLAACASPSLACAVGSALIDGPLAHPHLELVAIGPDGPLPLRTVSAFLVDNRSLHVQPHLGHTYANRGDRP